MNNWSATLRIADVWKNEELTFEQRRDEIVARIKRLPDCEHDAGLEDIATDLEEAGDVPTFDQAWDHFYDWADLNRVWVATF
jgi:hypothetical protein